MNNQSISKACSRNGASQGRSKVENPLSGRTNGWGIANMKYKIHIIFFDCYLQNLLIVNIKSYKINYKLRDQIKDIKSSPGYPADFRHPDRAGSGLNLETNLLHFCKRNINNISNVYDTKIKCIRSIIQQQQQQKRINLTI